MMVAVRYPEISEIISLLLSFLVATLSLRFGSKFFGIENPNMAKSVVAVFGGGIVASLLLTLPAGPIISALIYIYIVKSVLGLNWTKTVTLFCFIVVVELATYFALLPLARKVLINLK